MRGRWPSWPSSSRFTRTSAAFAKLLWEQGIAISMDGRGAWRDSVFIEWLWRSVKYKEVYLHAHDSEGEARPSPGQYPGFHNHRRSYSSLGAQTPEWGHIDQMPQTMEA